jgi:hypothetical protein
MVVVSLCEGRCQLDDAGRRIKHDFGWNMQIASKFVAVEQPCNVTAAISYIRSQRPELQRVLRRRYLGRDGEILAVRTTCCDPAVFAAGLKRLVKIISWKIDL